MDSKKRQGDDALLREASPVLKKRCVEAAEEMQWPCDLNDYCAVHDESDPEDVGYREIFFSIPLADIVLRPPPPLIGDTTDDCLLVEIPPTGVMKPSEKNPKFFSFDGFSIADYNEPDQCVYGALKYLDAAPPGLFGDELLDKLNQMVKSTLAESDRPKTDNPEHLAYFESLGLCRHTVPMAGEAIFTSAYLELLVDRHEGRIRIEIVDKNGNPVKADGYIFVLAMEQVLRQQAPMKLRKFFERHLRKFEDVCSTKERTDYILDPANHDILVGDLIPLTGGGQRLLSISWRTEDESTLAIKIDEDCEHIRIE